MVNFSCRLSVAMQVALMLMGRIYHISNRNILLDCAIWSGLVNAKMVAVMGCENSVSRNMNGIKSSNCVPSKRCSRRRDSWLGRSDDWSVLLITGMSEFENAPSANRRRRLLGIWNTKLRTSALPLAPKNIPINAILIKPKRREAAVQSAKIPVLSIFMHA